ncbi:hypothetical protein MLD38_024036 [Melastoma candidum]|uniref:Uncharacterized protein n=2 Tax=Melastoma candidum TaxID=119954 RepID=A0ACB9NRX8_9MYRT|nr:hypothetical protein MLD38_024036 [Melastoma candidum]
MGFGWSRGRRITDRDSRKKGSAAGTPAEITVPSHFLCPISLDLMKDPVTLLSGITYDRDSIQRWLEEGNFTCPVTNQVLRSFDQIPNHVIRRMIQDWCMENNQSRIPTPRVPVDPYEVMGVLDGIKDVSCREDRARCLELVRRIEDWGSECERNRRCIIVNGAATSLASAISEFAAGSSNNECMDRELMETLMSVLSWMFPLDSEARQHLSWPAVFRCMVWFMKNGDFSVKRNAILTLKEVCNDGSQSFPSVAEIEDLHEILVEFIKHPIHPTITKSSLSVMFSLISSSDEHTKRFLRLGAVTAILEALVDPDNSLCTKALSVLHGLTDYEEGIAEAYSNALTIPLLVKKILRVPELGTSYSVSILLRLSRHGDGKRVATEALQVGAFQKVLVLLQVGCGEETREKATKLLKLMNPYRDGLECTESIDFKNLKRSL